MQLLRPLIFLQPDNYHKGVKYLLMEYYYYHASLFPQEAFPCFAFSRMILTLHLVKMLAHQSRKQHHIPTCNDQFSSI